jgi:Coenzyme PQQ synthesis protein D (PqqD)
MRYRVNEPQVINEMIDGEAIMINLATGTYYSLNPSGADVWALVEASLPLEAIVDELARRYDAGPEDIRGSVERLLEELAAEDLVVASTDADPIGRAPDPGATPRSAFDPPKLAKFTDMQDLILLDPVHEVDSRGWPHVAGGDGTDPLP